MFILLDNLIIVVYNENIPNYAKMTIRQPGWDAMKQAVCDTTSWHGLRDAGAVLILKIKKLLAE